jgi:hypothetical protein
MIKHMQLTPEILPWALQGRSVTIVDPCPWFCNPDTGAGLPLSARPLTSLARQIQFNVNVPVRHFHSASLMFTSNNKEEPYAHNCICPLFQP